LVYRGRRGLASIRGQNDGERDGGMKPHMQPFGPCRGIFAA
jgi:hypothetical protein